MEVLESALAAQLERWQFFRKEAHAGSEDGCFANHCPHCGAMQEDFLLHAEPGDVFFCIPLAEPGSIEFTPLSGRIQVSGIAVSGCESSGRCIAARLYRKYNV
jgi:hypothetical protein